MTTDALQWMVNLLLPDIARLVGGLLILYSIVEFLPRIKDWLPQ